MKIKMLVMDVDGTLTDGRICIGPQGEAMKFFDVKDGYAIAQMLPPAGILPVIITGRRSKIVEYRAGELKIGELHQGVSNKLETLRQIARQRGVTREEIAYIGDDLNDLDCILWCAVTAAPADAVEQVTKQVSYVCRNKGGQGAVREFIEYLLAQNP